KGARRIVATARVDHEVDLHERHLVCLDEPNVETVLELVLLDRRQDQPRRRSERGRTRAIGGLLRNGQRRREEQKCSESRGFHRSSSGSTTSSTRRPSGNHSRAAACTSVG